MLTITNLPIEKARNIGPTIAKRLKGIGIHSLAELDKASPAVAYKRMATEQPGKHLPYCYYLYSLQGALLDMDWDSLPQDMKDVLRSEAER